MKTNNTNQMTFRYALSVLESEFKSTYRGIRTVGEMCSSFGDAVSWECESPDKVFHYFETEFGADRIVADDQIIQLANIYA